MAGHSLNSQGFILPRRHYMSRSRPNCGCLYRILEKKSNNPKPLPRSSSSCINHHRFHSSVLTSLPSIDSQTRHNYLHNNPPIDLQGHSTTEKDKGHNASFVSWPQHRSLEVCNSLRIGDQHHPNPDPPQIAFCPWALPDGNITQLKTPSNHGQQHPKPARSSFSHPNVTPSSKKKQFINYNKFASSYIHTGLLICRYLQSQRNITYVITALLIPTTQINSTISNYPPSTAS